MQQSQRLSAILERLTADGSVGVVELARALDVSAATVRRDLQLLESQRLLDRTHGGAVPQGVLYELPLRYKSARQATEKKRIAAEAASRVGEGWAIGLGGGTTTTEVARALVDRPQLTIVTNASEHRLRDRRAAEPQARRHRRGRPPGVLRARRPDRRGSLEGLNLDMVFMSVDGISARAHLTTHHEVEAGTNHALIARADRVTVVADSSKIGKVTFARICALDQVDELITDDGADPAEVAALQEQGLTVTLV